MEKPKFAVLQRIINGERTYGITPRIAGGFISPDNLIKIGQVAKKYKGVLKITSGQRIAILRLKAEDVEKAWTDLGMEPGVLSTYSVKNVEMCPATFCKRMKLDSLKLGMKLEKRYYGQSAPNRTKIGVSGCRNACGSVNAKDIGVIGTFDKGFVIKAGGSAGFHPRLADVIAENLNEDGAYYMVEAIYDYYNDKAEMGLKLGDFIDQLGLSQFIEDVNEIFKKKIKEHSVDNDGILEENQ
ncbi:MAG: NAD(P)/FAD-dependent oxidoreductase [Firmicutes bacterium]|jgi:NAD(P)H-nitrite reductase large subunit|nr:NAD(P)/FAD-dependent oxidoreductase [Bacillota bacterium]